MHGYPDLLKVKLINSRRQSRLIFLDKPFYSIYIFKFAFTFVFLYICIMIINYCNAQLKIYIDNCAIEINKIIIIYY